MAETRAAFGAGLQNRQKALSKDGAGIHEFESTQTLTMAQTTEILEAAKSGDAEASGRLFELVYAELRALAAKRMQFESSGHTLQPTALVHEAWLRLGGDTQPTWASRAHFFTAASEAMRRILVEAARRKRSLRRGGGQEFTDLPEETPAVNVDAERILQVNEALDRFAQIDPAKAELVKLRHFIGLSIPQAAAVLGISEATAKRHWAYARAWLLREL